MASLVSKGDAENAVLDYLIKNSPKNYSKFNPIKLELKEIAKGTDLSEEDVVDALNKLEEDPARIEEVNANFKFWLPLCEEGESTKKRLFQHNLAYYNLFLFGFISLLILYYVLAKAISLGWINLTTNDEFFFAGVLAVLLAIHISKVISNKFHALSEKMKNIDHYKAYVWSFVIFTVLILYIWNKGLYSNLIFGGMIFYISILANVITIALFLVNFFKKGVVKVKKKSKKKK